MKRITILLSLCLLCFASWAQADTLKIKANHPTRYVVQKGDTLWDISGRFLEHPWQWQELWEVNPQIKNPHLIYPGDVLVFRLVNGKPVLSREENGVRTVKLSPNLRSHDLNKAVPTIPLNIIKPFLNNSEILEPGVLDDKPYVVGVEDKRIVATSGLHIYARGALPDGIQSYAIFRQGEPYVDPETEEVLGSAAYYMGDAQLQRPGEVSTLLLSNSVREIDVGDRVLPIDKQQINPYFYPKAPIVDVQGVILSVLNGVTQIGKYNVIVINKGAREQLRVGDVLIIDRPGEKIIDDTAERTWWQKVRGKKQMVQLPDEAVGKLIVFRTFEKVSLGLIVQADNVIHVNDIVRNPG